MTSPIQSPKLGDVPCSDKENAGGATGVGTGVVAGVTILIVALVVVSIVGLGLKDRGKLTRIPNKINENKMSVILLFQAR